MGFARFPEVVPGEPSRPPLGGFNIGVGAYTNHADEAFQAAACVSDRKSQATAVTLDGLPPSRQDLYKSKTVLKAFPGFAPLVQEVDRRGRPAAADPGLSGRLAGDSGRDPAARQDRPQRPFVVL